MKRTTCMRLACGDYKWLSRPTLVRCVGGSVGRECWRSVPTDGVRHPRQDRANAWEKSEVQRAKKIGHLQQGGGDGAAVYGSEKQLEKTFGLRCVRKRLGLLARPPPGVVCVTAGSVCSGLKTQRSRARLMGKNMSPVPSLDGKWRKGAECGGGKRGSAFGGGQGWRPLARRLDVRQIPVLADGVASLVLGLLDALVTGVRLGIRLVEALHVRLPLVPHVKQVLV
mmetsp:Transcript_5831/g.19308  ORF Transcript_5831/g.19308 Transcript_5831/m.19308 type:complete len:225 (-) Transcript_5831:1237-1911(-)